MVKRINEKTRKKVVDAFYSGLSKNKVAKKFGISPTSVARFIKEAESHQVEQGVPTEKAPSPEAHKTVTEIEKRVRELEEKISYLESKKKGIGVEPLT